jgi:signal transduction histidine kinase/FixJ family two-component response regulator
MSEEHKSYEALEVENSKLKKELTKINTKVQLLFSQLSDGVSNLTLEKSEEKLSFIQDKLVQKEYLLDFSDEFIAICNEHFEFEFLNKLGHTLLSLSKEDPVKTFIEFIKEKEIFKKDVIPKLMKKKGWIGELTIQTKSRVFPSMCKIMPLSSSNDLANGGYYVILRDITESKEAIKKVLDSKNKAENNMIIRQQFLAKSSHEIRTSMSAIIGLSNLLIDEGLKGNKLEFASAIKLSADNLMVIINDILDISKIESGKLTVEKIRFDFSKLMLGVKSIFQHKIESAGVKFKYTIDARIPQFIIGDPTRLNQILLNLLSNSEKFTEHGEICLSARLVNKVNQKLKLQFEVKDTGIGIAGKNLEKIFQEFTQESDNTTRLYGGTGLGLAIVKQLVRLQKGKIWVESSKNKGSSFFVEIEYDTAKVNKSKGEFTADKLKSASIIMAEDYPMNRLLAKNLFKKWGLNLKIVNNGKELLLALDKHQYDVILMDVQMPKMGGIEATEKLRKKGVKTPVIAITGLSFKDEKVLCKEAGMNDFLTKPFEEHDLKQKLLNYLDIDYDDLPDLELKSSKEDTKLKLEHCSLDYIKELSAGDSEFVEDLLAIFMEEVPELVNKMIFSLNSRESLEISKYAHRLKSSFLMVKRKDIEANLKKMESWGNKSLKIKDPVDILSSIINQTQLVLNSISGYIGKPFSVKILPIEFLMSFDDLKDLSIDFSRLDEFGDGEIEFKKEIINLYSKQTTNQVEKVKKLSASKSYEDIALVIHNMIASFNLIGCQTLVNYSRGLEEVCLNIKNEERFTEQIVDYSLLIQESIILVNKKAKEEGIFD